MKDKQKKIKSSKGTRLVT